MLQEKTMQKGINTFWLGCYAEKRDVASAAFLFTYLLWKANQLNPNSSKHKHLCLKFKQCAKHLSWFRDAVSIVLVPKHGALEAVQESWFSIRKFAVSLARYVHAFPFLKLLFLLFLSLPKFTLKTCLSYELQRHSQARKKWTHRSSPF